MDAKLRGGIIIICALALGGCYTVLYGPQPVAVTALPGTETRTAPEAASAAQDADQWQDLYRYPGTPDVYGNGSWSDNRGWGGYGYGGYPGLSGYYYGAAAYPYHSYYGYGPYSYGYDPYYRDSYGYYAPAGYKLITTTELDALRAEVDALKRSGTTAADPEAARLRQLEEERRTREVWQRRTQPAVRRTPVATPNPPPSADNGASSSAYGTAPSSSGAGSVSSGSSTSKAATDEEAKASGSPRKRRR